VLAAVGRPIGLGDDGDDLVRAQKSVEGRESERGRAVEEDLQAPSPSE
jgi:hypothetical protein